MYYKFHSHRDYTAIHLILDGMKQSFFLAGCRLIKKFNVHKGRKICQNQTKDVELCFLKMNGAHERVKGSKEEREREREWHEKEQRLRKEHSEGNEMR